MKRQLINLRLPPELVARVDAHAKELGQTRTMFIERALESALKPAPLDGLGPSPSPERVKASARAAQPVSGVQRARSLVRDPAAMERQARLNKARGS